MHTRARSRQYLIDRQSDPSQSTCVGLVDAPFMVRPGWVDHSLCEKTFSLSRDGTNFVRDVAHNTKQQCNEVMTPGATPRASYLDYAYFLVLARF